MATKAEREQKKREEVEHNRRTASEQFEKVLYEMGRLGGDYRGRETGDINKTIAGIFDFLTEDQKILLLKKSLKMSSLIVARSLSQKMDCDISQEKGLKQVLPLLEGPINGSIMKRFVQMDIRQNVKTRFGSENLHLLFSKAMINSCYFRVHENQIDVMLDTENNTGAYNRFLVWKCPTEYFRKITPDPMAVFLKKLRGKDYLLREERKLFDNLYSQEGLAFTDANRVRGHLNALAARWLPSMPKHPKETYKKQLAISFDEHAQDLKDLFTILMFDVDDQGREVLIDSFCPMFWKNRANSELWVLHLRDLIREGFLYPNRCAQVLVNLLTKVDPQSLEPDFSITHVSNPTPTIKILDALWNVVETNTSQIDPFVFESFHPGASYCECFIDALRGINEEQTNGCKTLLEKIKSLAFKVEKLSILTGVDALGDSARSSRRGPKI